MRRWWRWAGVHVSVGGGARRGRGVRARQRTRATPSRPCLCLCRSVPADATEEVDGGARGAVRGPLVDSAGVDDALRLGL